MADFIQIITKLQLSFRAHKKVPEAPHTQCISNQKEKVPGLIYQEE